MKARVFAHVLGNGKGKLDGSITDGRTVPGLA